MSKPRSTVQLVSSILILILFLAIRVSIDTPSYANIDEIDSMDTFGLFFNDFVLFFSFFSALLSWISYAQNNTVTGYINCFLYLILLLLLFDFSVVYFIVTSILLVLNIIGIWQIRRIKKLNI